eukprot:TRINITY_DN69407_c0_g1_i1.p1 TRINITY_DN69407_c0_g1~~TRINITY_DN69407_c0_g1_i1.p1  ORF type:complete len:142 (-),score=15.56 TRINITY_DN69407_c0_g1_i1:80-505(-)
MKYCPRPLGRPYLDVTIATDASKKGWGPSLQSLTASGQWSLSEQDTHINLVRDDGSPECPASVSNTTEGQMCVCSNRQDNSGILSQGGRDKVQPAIPFSVPDITVVPDITHHDQHCVREKDGQQEEGGRLVKTLDCQYQVP